MYNTILISSEACTGKTTFAKKNKKVLDLDFFESKILKGLSEKKQQEQIYRFVKIIKKLQKSGVYEYILITTDSRFVKEYINQDLEMAIVLPHIEDIHTYVDRARKRGNTPKWIKEYFEVGLKEITIIEEMIKETNIKLFKISKDEFLEDLIPNIDKIFKKS